MTRKAGKSTIESDHTLDYETNPNHHSRVFEYTWQWMFTGRGQHCESMEECYCKTYNFCVQSRRDLEDLDQWNALRTRREEIQWQLNFAQDALWARMNESIDAGASTAQLAQVEKAFQGEIDKLSWRLTNLSEQTWRKREDIIHYWKLPLPPTGW